VKILRSHQKKRAFEMKVTRSFYRVYADAAALIVLLLGGYCLTELPNIEENIWISEDWHFQVAYAVLGINYFGAFWCYAKSKGHHGFYGIFLSLTGAAGLLAILRLDDVPDIGHVTNYHEARATYKNGES
jgi:hypothetical protein